MRRFLLGLILVVATMIAVYACKQGEGDVCQINDDCEDGLSCNAGTGRCQLPGANVPDAAPIPDADTTDADTTDADTTDADTTDAAMIDAALL